MEDFSHVLAVVHRLVGLRLMPVTASLAIHVAIVGSILLLPSWTASRESVLLLELIEPEAPPAPVAQPPAAKPDPRPLTPPKLVKKPMPAPPVARPEPVEERVEK